MDTTFAPVSNADQRIEMEIARDLAKHAVYLAPLALVAGFVAARGAGILGAAVALVVVAGNFLASAAMLGWAARISAGALTATALGGFIVRLGVITVVGIGVKQLDAVHFSTFCIVLVVAHLGLLFLELRHVSLTLAYPGLKPEKEKA